MINIIIEVLYIAGLLISIIAGLLLIVMIRIGIVTIQQRIEIIKVKIIIIIRNIIFPFRRKIYSSLKKGDVFVFGWYDGKELKWRVLDIGNGRIYVLCETIICDKKIDDSGKNSNKWSQSTLREWLNEDFYKSAFINAEKEYIKKDNNDKVTLLSKEEAEKLMRQPMRSLGSYWWLCTASHNLSDYAWRVYSDGSLGTDRVDSTNGVRPALNLKL